MNKLMKHDSDVVGGFKPTAEGITVDKVGAYA